MKHLNDIHRNQDNPRLVKDKGFRDLKKSLSDAPWMMKLRPIVVDESGMILAGDKRYLALAELKYREVPDEWIVSANDLTDEQKREFIVKDNTHAGEWDWDKLANEWDAAILNDWGLAVPHWDAQPGDNPMLDNEGEPPGNPSAARRETDDDYSVFDVVLPITEKTELLTILNTARTAYKLEKLSDALMLIVRSHNYNATPTE